MTGICLPNESFYTDIRIQNYILNNFGGILFAGERQGYEFYLLHKDKLKKSMSLNGSVMDKNLRVYVDEPISNLNFDNMYLKGIIDKYPNVIIGELELDVMIDLTRKYEIGLAYTAYRELWFRFFGYRIYKWWKNQLDTWRRIDRFTGNLEICWINFNQMNDKELFDWAKMHNKEIWIYVETNLTIKDLTKISN